MKDMNKVSSVDSKEIHVALHDLNPNILVSIIENYGTCYLTIDRQGRRVRFLNAKVLCKPLDSFFIQIKAVKGTLLNHKNVPLNPSLLILRIRIYLRKDLSRNIRTCTTFLERYGNECRDTEDRKAYGYLDRKISIPEGFHVEEYWNRTVRPDMIKSYLIHSNFNWIQPSIGKDDIIDMLIFLSWIGGRLGKYGIKVSPSKDEFGLKKVAFGIYKRLDDEFLDNHAKGLLRLPFFDYWYRRR